MVIGQKESHLKFKIKWNYTALQKYYEVSNLFILYLTVEPELNLECLVSIKCVNYCWCRSSLVICMVASWTRGQGFKSSYHKIYLSTPPVFGSFQCTLKINKTVKFCFLELNQASIDTIKAAFWFWSTWIRSAHFVFYFTICCNNVTHRSILDWTTQKCGFDLGICSKCFFCSIPTAFVFLSVIVISGITPGFINGIDPLQINQFPSYLLVYMHHHITGQLVNLLGLVMYYSKHEQLKKKLRDQVCDAFERVKSRMWRSSCCDLWDS